uniref:UBIQUITIN_CONJUGAT_2 domain-containing protein n=1 Tax=Syphacia muris TaxID=451379 RepID=A0A0N5B001_9BILA
MTSGRQSSVKQQLDSFESNDLSTEAFELATEMSAGTPLQYTDKLLLEHLILSEYALICREPVDGVYVTPIWFGVLFIRRGVYMGAVLRFTLNLPTAFGVSTELPKVVFDINVFHPHVDQETHRLDISRFFLDGWKPEKHHVYHVLLAVQRSFFNYDADASSCSNPDAAVMLRDNKEQFMVEAQKVIRESRSIVYDPPPTSDPHAFRFFPWDPSVHEPLRRRLLGNLTESQISESSFLNSLGCSQFGSCPANRDKSGFSWVSPTEGFYMTEQPRSVDSEVVLIFFSE